MSGYKIRERLHLAIVAFALGLGLVVMFRDTSIAQNSKETPPGSIRLLPGYVHHREQGIDSLVGRISKPGGPTIFYDIGKFGSTSARELSDSGKALWSKSQVIDGTPLVMAMRDDQTLVLMIGKPYPHVYGSFEAQRVRTPEDLADVLLMLSTFRPE
jgi:hypothetical protein